jgi:multisubunit Na+/H+ antiporter MnhF subunit
VNDIIFYIALVWMLALLLATVMVVIRADGTLTRVLALDALTLILTALLILYSTTTGRSYYLDAAIMLALLSFMSTVAVSRYYSEEGLE